MAYNVNTTTTTNVGSVLTGSFVIHLPATDYLHISSAVGVTPMGEYSEIEEIQRAISQSNVSLKHCIKPEESIIFYSDSK